MNQSQREELPALVQVVVYLTGAQEDLGQQLHVLLPGLSVARVEEREVGEQLAQGCVFRLNV